MLICLLFISQYLKFELFLTKKKFQPLWTNVSSSNMQDVLYPDDFATEPNRVPPGQYDSIPPIISRQSKPKMYLIFYSLI